MKDEVNATLGKYLDKDFNTVHYWGDAREPQKLQRFFERSSGIGLSYEKPDAFIKIDNELLIIEHFEFDCYPRNRRGSKYKSEKARIEKRIEDMVPTDSNPVQYGEIIRANSSYKYYLENVMSSFDKHYACLPQYKDHLLQDGYADKDTKFTVCFLIDDVSPFGTLTYDGKNYHAVVLPASKEFLQFFESKKDVDWVLTTMTNDNDDFHVWFLSQSQIFKYKKKAIDYANQTFLRFDPMIMGAKILLPLDCYPIE